MNIPFKPFVNKKAYLLKHKSQCLGFSEHHGERIRNYVIAFDNLVIARSVHYSINPKPFIRLERDNPIDITTDVNRVFVSCGIPMISDKITIDVVAKLFIPKMDYEGGTSFALNDGGFHLSEERFDDVLMYPFDKNVGVIIPHELDYEDLKQMVFFSQVIEPIDSIQSFKQSLIE